MPQSDVDVPTGIDESWKCGPLAHSTKDEYLNEVLPRFFAVHPFYKASNGFIRLYNLDGRIDARQSSEADLSHHSAAGALYPSSISTKGTIQRLLGIGGGGIAFHARRLIANQRPSLPNLLDSSFTVNENTLPSVATTPLRLSSTSGNNASCSINNNVPLHPDVVRPVAVPFAVKFIPLEHASIRMISYCLREARVLRSCNFFSIMKLYHSYATVRSEVTGVEETIDARDDMVAHRGITAVTLELEFLNSGDLHGELETRARQHPQRFFSQRNVLLIFVQLVMAVYYLHEKKKTLHRDIKSANVFLCNNGLVKLGDFGFSKPYDTAEGVRVARIGSFCGTPQYMAPEVWSVEPYGEKADMFSLGVVLFEMMEMRRPFVGITREAIRQSVLNCSESPPVFEHDLYTEELKSLTLQLLDKDPTKRPAAIQVLALPFIRQTIGTLLDVVHKDPAVASERSTSNVLIGSPSSADGSSSGFPAEVRSPMTPGTRSSIASTLNLSGGERDSILSDVRGVVADIVRFVVCPRRSPASAAATPSSVEATAGTASPHTATRASTSSSLLPPINSSKSIPRAPSTSFPCSIVPADGCSTLLISGTLYKESAKSEWKRRYLQLYRRDPPGRNTPSTAPIVPPLPPPSFELFLSISQKSNEQGGPKKAQQLMGYIDCYPFEMENYHGFALQSGNGSALRFIPGGREERDQWVMALLNCILSFRTAAM